MDSAVATTPSSSCVAREWTDCGRAVGRYDGEGAIATGGSQSSCVVCPVATMPSSSCVAREWTDCGRAVGRYDGEGAIAT
ncbi:MAG: hypothetical protein PUJ80_06195, partial [Verrucomicrobiota bacterium]|nr:hypothetical protein [Verrucomicrobiota bacterium]